MVVDQAVEASDVHLEAFDLGTEVVKLLGGLLAGIGQAVLGAEAVQAVLDTVAEADQTVLGAVAVAYQVVQAVLGAVAEQSLYVDLREPDNQASAVRLGELEGIVVGRKLDSQHQVGMLMDLEDSVQAVLAADLHVESGLDSDRALGDCHEGLDQDTEVDLADKVYEDELGLVVLDQGVVLADCFLVELHRVGKDFLDRHEEFDQADQVDLVLGGIQRQTDQAVQMAERMGTG